MVNNGIICTRIILFYSDPVLFFIMHTFSHCVFRLCKSIKSRGSYEGVTAHLTNWQEDMMCLIFMAHTLQLLSIMAATVKIFKSLSGLINFLKYLICDMHSGGCTRVVTPWKIGDGHI